MDIAVLEQSLDIPPGLYARLIKRGEASGATATSPAGAYGQAQLMPGTAAELGVDRYDPDQNLYGGALYLKQLLDRFHGDETKAVEAYNEGPGRVNRGIVYPETAAYVHRVTGADVVPTTGTDASGGIMQALAPFLQQAISAQQPDATEQALFKKSQDQSDTTAQALEASRARYADLGQKMGQLKSPASINQADFQPPNPQDIQNQELAKVSNEPNQPLRALQQFLPLVAIFGGAFARRSGTAALDAATAAITAAKNNDQAAVEKAHQEFTDQMTALKERMDAAKTVYDENRNKYGDDMAGFAAQQSIQEAQDKNELALEALKTGQWEKYFQMKNAGLTAFDKLLPVISAAEYHSAVLAAANPTPPDASTPQARDAQIAEMSKDPGVLLAATQYLKTGQMPNLGMGSAAKRTQIIELAGLMAQKAPGGVEDVPGSRAEFHADTQALTQLEKTRTQVGQFEGTAEREADLALKLASKGEAGKLPVLNRWIQGGRAATGDPDVTAFNSALVSFKNEYARIMSTAGAGGGGMTSDAARSEAQSLINNAMSPEQLEQTIATMKQSMGNRIAALDAEYEATKARLGAPGGEGEGRQPSVSGPPAGAPADTKQAPDGHWYSPDPNRPGKYLRWDS